MTVPVCLLFEGKGAGERESQNGGQLPLTRTREFKGMYDCIIVGAGPAGATAAYHLSKAGHRVLIIEAAQLPRYKPCGGGVSPQIAEWFDFDFSPAISVKVRRVQYTLDKQQPVEVELPAEHALWMVRRDVFDHFIVKQAQGQGANSMGWHQGHGHPRSSPITGR